MTDLSTLRSLQKRIREATGADRDLDFEIADTFEFYHGGPPCSCGDVECPGAALFTTDPDGLGACVALMHATLPRCEWTRDADGEFALWRETGSPQQEICWISEAPKLVNDCLTFIDAICAARIAELEAEEKTNA